MLATALSVSLLGLHVTPIRVEVQAHRGIPSFELVGLAEAAVRESRVRVKSALAQIGVDLSEYRIVVNLAPADVKKYGSGFDLAIAAAALGALKLVDPAALEGVLFLGELSLAGSVHGVRGVLPKLVGARSHGVKCAVVPKPNEAEAALASGIEAYPVATLAELVTYLRGTTPLPLAQPAAPVRGETTGEDLEDVRGQESARRALEICAAGAHNLLMVGPPGAGKTMLARRLPTILPLATPEEALEITAVHSVAGLLGSRATLLTERPFRAPHHTVSEAGLVGGGEWPRPGEVSLAHQGVLFLDELPEFRRVALESLRQPLEDGVVTVSRAQGRATFPARPLVAAAMNPCPCGFHGDGSGRCVCTGERVRAYRGRLSGPLVDRLDVHVALPAVAVNELRRGISGESSAVVRERVAAARERQSRRAKKKKLGAAVNAVLSARELESVVSLCGTSEMLLTTAVSRLGLSARAYGKVLRVARTIADLAGREGVEPEHVAEAVGFRLLDRGLPTLPAAA